ncbi:hypothetical protein D0869_08143 [Hortaea werneckii]|uniref:Autophagy-related protein 27 n=1 Tax=Hortaea werneckii TaxID=91943 RepID=A0A3M6WME5_HORWE|nr:hypothetical protein KC324_g12157 [Hortaea werneckii]KAI7569165.1 hypothetical protein KC316_g12265 [Hortaea werneckii]KAI7657298.1 hypothetical protein KC318_g11881 [Hortaea werneckii]RMX79659.1 hypothetical protein D0869_08143 [Hortaea werneckii]RMY02360.1 hypothetical protein D0868_08006 [Hortaea werneckii]
MPSLRHPASALFLLPGAISAATFDCSHVRVDKQSFDLSELGGPKTVHFQQYLPPSVSNTTYTVDICKPLQRTKGVPKTDECPTGTRVCSIEQIYNQADDSSTVGKVIPIAGDYAGSSGRTLDPVVTRLKGSSSHEDSKKEGLRVELNGGKYPTTRDGQPQKAIIEFHCNKDLTGNEGFEEDAEAMLDMATYASLTRRADDEDEDDPEPPELPDLDKGKSLEFISYKPEEDMGVLRLKWNTRFACEGQAGKPSGGSSKGGSHWGFFTWFIIILFLLTAAYIIFGSWLNYNRYGARGWDLLPHGDTIRDVPYIVKEWAGDMIDRMKGSDSRGGYSAV